MIADTWLLLQLRWHVTWNGFRHRSTAAQVFSRDRRRTGGGYRRYGRGAARGGHWHADAAYPNADLAALLPGCSTDAGHVHLLLTSFGVALGSLFLTNDLDTLMSAPIDTRAVFLSKILDAMLPSYMILAVSAVPALLAYGLGLGFGPLYYLACVGVLASPLIPVGLASLLVMLVARVAPVRRVREVLGLMGALFGSRARCSAIPRATGYGNAAT